MSRTYRINPQEGKLIAKLDNPESRDARLAIRQSRKVIGSFTVGRREDNRGSRAYQTPTPIGKAILESYLQARPKLSQW